MRGSNKIAKFYFVCYSTTKQLSFPEKYRNKDVQDTSTLIELNNNKIKVGLHLVIKLLSPLIVYAIDPYHLL